MRIIYDIILNKFRVKDSSSGGSSATSITYAALLASLAANTATSGFYLITDATSAASKGLKADKGILVQLFKDADGIIRIREEAEGVFLNQDYQDIGDYSGVVALTGIAKGTNQKVWYSDAELYTLTYNNLLGGTFSLGDTITETVNMTTGLVVSDDGIGSMTIFKTSGGDFVPTNPIDNGIGVTADLVTRIASPYVLGDIVFRNGYHYQIVDDTKFNGSSPAANANAYEQLPKTTANMGYVTEIDFILYDISIDRLLYREDKRQNKINSDSIGTFQWGNDVVNRNTATEDAVFDMIDSRSTSFAYNNASLLSYVIIDNRGVGPVIGNKFSGVSSFECNFNTGAEALGNSTLDSIIGSIVLDSSKNFTGKILQRNYSDFDASMAIDGLTTLDITAALNYIGIANLTSANATESINLFSNFPDDQEVEFKPEAGLTVTFVHNTGANQPRCEGGVNVVLNGTNGDWVRFKKKNGVIYQINIGTY